MLKLVAGKLHGGLPPVSTATWTTDFGLMFYNAPWYDPTIGRFVQADTVVPGGVQGYDRYAYANNDPVGHNDPTGHCIEDACILEMAIVTSPLWVPALAAAVAHVRSPQSRESADEFGQTIWNATERGLQRVTGAQHNMNLTLDRILYPNPNRPPSKSPLSECFKSAQAVAFCGVSMLVAATIIYNSIAKGGCDATSSNSSCLPPAPTPTPKAEPPDRQERNTPLPRRPQVSTAI